MKQPTAVIIANRKKAIDIRYSVQEAGANDDGVFASAATGFDFLCLNQRERRGRPISLPINVDKVCNGCASALDCHDMANTSTLFWRTEAVENKQRDHAPPTAFSRRLRL